MKRRALVSGGAGFIGSHVADHYLAAGYDVTVVDDLSTGREENIPRAAEFVHADICSTEVRRLLEQTEFHVLNHHAAQMDVRLSVEDPSFDARVNILGLLNLLEGARAGGTERVVFASSGGVVYGESDDLPHPEHARKLPVSPYGVSKLTSEFYLAAYTQLYGMRCVALRYANVYGPRQNPHGEAGVVAIFCSRINEGQQLTVFGDGGQTRDYVFVRDVARANVLATEWWVDDPNTIDATAFNIGTAMETSVNELAQTLIDAAGTDVSITHVPERAGELRRSAVAIDRAARDLDWKPEIALSDGLRQTYDWIRENAA